MPPATRTRESFGRMDVHDEDGLMNVIRQFGWALAVASLAASAQAADSAVGL